MSSAVAGQQKILEQLQLEASVPRKNVSECVADMMKFIDENLPNDCLVNGIPNKKNNPFQEKSGCDIL
ncbi:guanine nucleotide-binding protein subunit gamma-1-like [Tubulanus polymorphus]|uniref:guanine nucleotide-binding protein subunit gamma-1-like n=1 Tax=Tubulanus polymorphus TaxID=672921 RepID=UPI003DA6597F